MVEAELAAAGQVDVGEGAPAEFQGLVAGDLACLELLQGGVQVVAGEVQFVRAVLLGGVDGHFGGGQGEDEPAVAGVDVGEVEDVAEAITRAESLGGKKLVGPITIPTGTVLRTK